MVGMNLKYGDTISHDRQKITRPWGDYVNVYEHPGIKSKVIRLNPGATIPNQFHEYHDEHWLVLAGRGVFTVSLGKGTGLVQGIGAGQMVDIPKGQAHMVTAGNEGLTFLEIQVALIVPGGDAVMVD